MTRAPAAAKSPAANQPDLPPVTRAAPQNSTPRPAAPPPSAAPKQRIGDDAFFPGADADGFGTQSFPTARGDSAPVHDDNAPHDIDAIRREGLTGRQLRMARRLAQKYNLPATSDFDAVRLLRQQGIDPFQANSVLELVQGGADQPPTGSRALTLTQADAVRLPQTIKPMQLPSPDQRAEMAHIAEVGRIQRDIAARRRKKTVLLAARLFVFVGLPTLLAAIYYYTIATPFYSTHAEFVIQQATGGRLGQRRGQPVARHLDGHLARQHRGAGLSAIARCHEPSGSGSGLPRPFQQPRHRPDSAPPRRGQQLGRLQAVQAQRQNLV
jgi:capsular polysaccharide transport system permease protein